ncbi:MAG: hypothetical protein Q9227_001165 [Pyrenula ochraceoflavens]
MSSSHMDQAEMENFQRMSDAYQPDVTKLSGTHTQYRRIIGDGKCGWRAAVFGYFELLLQTADVATIIAEKERINGFKRLFQDFGTSEDIYEFFVEPTEEVFDKIIDAARNGNRDESFLVETFNVQNHADSIIFHFRLMTSVFMKRNAELYQGFLEEPVESYCQNKIEAVGQEIEQPGLYAVTSGVISPGGIFALEVLYLDLSEGDQVTRHSFLEGSANCPTITLLYRPGHYDMLYRAPHQQTWVQYQPDEDMLVHESVESVGMDNPTSLWALTDLANEFSLFNAGDGFSDMNTMPYDQFPMPHGAVDHTFNPPISASIAEPEMSASPSVSLSSSVSPPQPDPFRMSSQMYRPQSHGQVTMTAEPFRKYSFPPNLSYQSHS